MPLFQCPFLLFFGNGKRRVPRKSGRQRQPRAPHKVLLEAVVSAPGDFTYCRSPLPRFQIRKLDVPLSGCRPDPARNRGRRSRPRATLAPGEGGARGWDQAPNPAPAGGGVKGAPAGQPAPALGGHKVPPGPGTHDRRASPSCADYLPTFYSYRAGARRAPGWERRPRRRPFSLRKPKLRLQGFS